MITPAAVQHTFAQHGLQLHRYATSPELCDRRSCSGVDSTGRVVYVAAAPRTDFMVIVFPTLADAGSFGVTPAMRAERRKNTVLVYLRSASARLAIVRRIFRS